MMNQQSPGLWQRAFSAAIGVLKRGLLGKSGSAYMKQFSGSDEYWERSIAAQLGWPEKQPPGQVPDHAPDPVRSPVEPGNGSAPGWNKGPFDEELAHHSGLSVTRKPESRAPSSL
jgi:hypothetical protein